MQRNGTWHYNEDMLEKRKTFRKVILSWCCIIVASLLLLTLSYVLPNGRIRRNISDAPGIMIAEGEHPEQYLYKPGAELDNFTDAIILNVAVDINQNRNPLEKAITNSFYFSNDPEITQSQYLKKALEDPSVGTNSDYIRYWFGSSAVMRFLALFFNFKEIRYILSITIMLLFVLAVSAIYRKLGAKYAIFFALSLLFTRIFSVSAAIQYAPVFIITLLSVIAVCKLSDMEKYHKYLPFVFMASGTLTVIFDLLTFPLMTLGLPLVVALLIELKSEKKIDYKTRIKKSFFYCVIWGISYAMTNLIKWIIASIVLGRNEITPAIEQFFFRANAGEGEKLPIGSMYGSNIMEYFSKIALIILAICIVVWIILAIKKRIHCKQMIPLTIFAVIALFPYIWYGVLSNHSYIHYWMTYRIQAIAFFAFLSGLYFCLDYAKTTTPKKLKKK